MSTETFGQRLRRLRGGKTQLVVAKALGVDNTVLSRMEADNKKKVDPALIINIAEYFGVTTDFILGYTDDPQGRSANSYDLRGQAMRRRVKGQKSQPVSTEGPMSDNDSESEAPPADPLDLEKFLQKTPAFYKGIELSDEDKKKIDDYVRFMLWELEKQKGKKD